MHDILSINADAQAELVAEKNESVSLQRNEDVFSELTSDAELLA